MPTRRTTWCLLLWSVMWITSARAQPLVLDVVPGFDGVCPGEGCYPVTVWIQGRRASSTPAVYEVQVTATSWKGSSNARKTVTLAGDAVSQAVGVLLCTPDEPYEITARLFLRGRLLAASKPVSAKMAQWYPLLVGLGTDNSALTYLPQRSLGVVSMEGRLLPADTSRPQPPPSLFPQAGADNRRLFIGRTRNSLPPDSALAYRGVAALSLDDRAWDTLTERQQQALIDYVLSGGLLVVHGVDINRLQSLKPSGLLPVEPLGLASVPAGGVGDWIPTLRTTADALPVVRSRPLGDAKVILRYREIPLVVVAPKALGQVVFLAFDPNQPPLNGGDESHVLWRKLLSLHVRRFVPPLAVFPESERWAGPFWEQKGLYSQFVQAMVNAVAAKPVPLNWLIAYLGVYILVLIPLNYLVLRRLDRLHLSWFTLPVLAVLTSVGGYLMAARMQMGTHQMRQWTVWYTTSGAPQAIVESDWVLYSARTQRYRLRAGIDGILLENSPSDLQSRRVAEIPQETPAELRDVPIPLWSARTFHLSGTMNLMDSVNISTVRQGKDELVIRLHNNTPFTLRNIRVVFPDGYYVTTASCRPGERSSISVSEASGTFTRFVVSPPPFPGYPPPQPADASGGQGWRRQAMQNWLSLAGIRLSREVGSQRLSTDAMMGSSRRDLSRGLLVAEVQDAPHVVEVLPLPSSSRQQVTVLSVYFEAQGGKP